MHRLQSNITDSLLDWQFNWHWVMTHTLCVPGDVSSPACLPFNPHSLFLVDLHNSWTWACMGPQFYLEPTVPSYKWTRVREVKPHQRSLRSTELKEGNVFTWSQGILISKVCGATLKFKISASGLKSAGNVTEKGDTSHSSAQKSFIRVLYHCNIIMYDM